MAKKITTLFIRDTSINLLVMNGNQVSRWASLPLEPGLVDQGVIQDEAQVANRVRDLFRLEKISADKVIVGLSGINSLYRLITVPELPEAILAEAVKHEARRVVPVSLDEVYLAYQSVPAPRGETRVFLVAFPRNVTDALIRTIKLAGLEPHIMDLAPLALGRIPDEPRAIIVNVRLDHCEIIVIEDRIPQIIRRVALPSEAASLSERLPTITEEFSRTVVFYNSSHLEQPLDSTVPVFVCGDLTAAPETWQSMVGRLGSSVSQLSSPVVYPEAFPVDEFMVNIGLALKKLSSEPERVNSSIVNINILPEEYLPQALPKTLIYTSAGIAVGVALIVFMGFLVLGSRADTVELRSKLALTQTNIAQHQVAIAVAEGQVGPLEDQVQTAGTEVELVEADTDVFRARFNSLSGERAKVDEDLVQIVKPLPSKLYLNSISHGNSSIVVSGTAQSEPAAQSEAERQLLLNDVFAYARALRESGRFSRVIISAIDQVITSTIEVEEEKVDIIGFSFEFLLGEEG
jgi:type IV pilus assembly protein PilM